MSDIRKSIKKILVETSGVESLTHQARYDVSKSVYLEDSNLFVSPAWVTLTSPPSCFEGKTITRVPNMPGTFSELGLLAMHIH
jgi:hypothetical protein